MAGPIFTSPALAETSWVLIREVQAEPSDLSQSDLRAHFGLGDPRRADKLEIRWPSRAVDTLQDIEANPILTVTESRGVTDRTGICGGDVIAR